jgi:hypothetical protein
MQASLRFRVGANQTTLKIKAASGTCWCRPRIFLLSTIVYCRGVSGVSGTGVSGTAEVTSTVWNCRIGRPDTLSRRNLSFRLRLFPVPHFDFSTQIGVRLKSA